MGETYTRNEMPELIGNEPAASLHVFPREGGEVQRVLLVRPESWESLRFFSPEPSPGAFENVCSIYRDYLVPACPWIFGTMLLFRLEEDGRGETLTHPLLGSMNDRTLLAAATLRDGLTLRRGRLHAKTPEAETLLHRLEARGNVQTVAGKLPTLKIIPVGNLAGALTRSRTGAKMKVNASFFIMDCFDTASPYDLVGTPFGLMVRDGEILSPPLFDREALLVGKEGQVTVACPRLSSLTAEINGKDYQSGKNAVFYSRPACRCTPRGRGIDAVIVGTEVRAVRRAGGTAVPASGFVLRTEEEDIRPGMRVRYRGMEELRFGLQVGNSTVRDGSAVREFHSRFYQVRHPWETAFPPSLYPLDYDRARAARIALGADEAGRPLLLWAEGAAKQGHIPGKDSCGASLSELAEICVALGMKNGVNLDGGGSAQILLRGERPLFLSDRSPKDFCERERAVPNGLIVE